MSSINDNAVSLDRTIGFPLLVLYGMGTMIGAGFYALSGKVAGEAGMYAPLAFGAAGLLALFSALTFAEFSSRLPHAGGSARYLEEAFGKRWLSALTGWLIITTGIVSAATLAVAMTGFVQDFVALPERPTIIALSAAMGAIAAWGIRQAVGVVVAISMVQLLTLAYVAVAALAAPDAPLEDWSALVPAVDEMAWIGIVGGGFLAFYAFIGFEDMVNLAEEVREPRRVLPRALVAAMLLTTVVYMLVSAALVLAVPPARLAEANTPLAEAVRHHGQAAIGIIGVVSILSALNSALVQIVMVARVAYGMANRGYAPAAFSIVGRRTRTPWLATILATVVIAVLAAFLELTTLARLTSAVILLVFIMVNLGLWWLKGFDRADRPSATFSLPRSVPLAGAATMLAVLAFKSIQLIGNA
ncbi:MAG: amino acid permease, partial [Wenzhouxiangellaceae bacterium]|nr:amino acid permease [Wenzhouxiangellaceae bacterium]